MEFLFPLPWGKGSGEIFLLREDEIWNYEPAPAVFWEWAPGYQVYKSPLFDEPAQSPGPRCTKTDPGQIQKKIIAGQLCLGSQGKAVRDKKLLEKFAGGAGFFPA